MCTYCICSVPCAATYKLTILYQDHPTELLLPYMRQFSLTISIRNFVIPFHAYCNVLLQPLARICQSHSSCADGDFDIAAVYLGLNFSREMHTLAWTIQVVVGIHIWREATFLSRLEQRSRKHTIFFNRRSTLQVQHG